MPNLLAALLTLLLFLPAPALRAQGLAAALKPPQAASPAAATPSRPVLSQAEARQLTDLLNDPQKRASFEATLQTLAKAQEAAAPAPKPAVPLAPDSVGAQLLKDGSSWLTGLSSQLVTFGHLLGNLPSVWSFTERTAQDPVLRARALDAAWRMTLILAVAALAEWGLSLLLRGPIRAIAAHAPAGDERADDPEAEPVVVPKAEPVVVPKAEPVVVPEAEPVVVPEAEPVVAPKAERVIVPAAEPVIVPEAERTVLPPALDVDQTEPGEPEAAIAAVVEERVRQRRFRRTLRALRRLPFVLLAFLLDLMPLGLFVGAGYAGTLLAAPQIQDVLQAAILAYAICRLAVTITRMFVSPEAPRLRLLHVSDEGAAYAVVWVRRVFAVGAFGFAATTIGHIFGLPQQANDAFLKTVFLLVHLFLVVIVLQCRAPVARQIRGHGDPSRAGYRVRSRIASIWHFVAIFYIVGLWLVWAAEVRNGYLRVWHIFLVACGILTVARLCGIVVLGAVDRVFRVSPALSERYPGLEARANRYYPLLRGTITSLLFVLTALALLQAWGIDTLAWFGARALGGKLASAILTIFVAGILAVAVWEAVNTGMDRHLARLTREAQVVKSARLRTLLPILRTVLSFALVAVFVLTALSEIGVNIAPLLAGAGILGVAIGFGSQKLVQDFITGIFLLLENAMQVGDWVTVAGLSGSVENLSIRTMRLRAGDGSVHIIPFSSVSTVTNVNRGIGNAAVSVGVPMEEDSDRVCEVLTEIARGMRGEPRFAEMMRSDLQLWGVDRVADGTVTIAGQIVCTDSGRWAVQREFNRRMTLQFKACGLRIATPMQTVYNFEANPAPKRLATPSGSAAPEELPDQLAKSPPPQALGNTS